MPQSLSAVYLHLVFSTKDRRPYFRDRLVRTDLHLYLGGVAKQLNCPPLTIGGVEDHVHLLVQFGRTITQADMIKELKRASHVWSATKFPGFQQFAWQAGYATFSVSQSNLKRVGDYICRQEEHHQKRSFQEELRALLEKHKLGWDEQYLWD